MYDNHNFCSVLLSISQDPKLMHKYFLDRSSYLCCYYEIDIGDGVNETE